VAEASRKHDEAVLEEIAGGMSDADRRYLEEVGMRRLIAEGHADGMKNGYWGRYDDVIAARQPWGFDPRDISVPVLLAQGEDDTFTLPREFEWLRANIPIAQGEIYPGMGHMGTLDVVPTYYRMLGAQARQ
jgi:pimeloyl-ACP methyl ester carboxylesterase